MTRIRGAWVRTGLLVSLLGAAACGSITTLGPDGGGGTGGSSAGTHGMAGTQGTAGTQGAAGAQGAAGTQGMAGTQGTAGTGSAGSTADAGMDAPIERAPSCPATFTSLADGAPCPSANGPTCDYAEGRCGCMPCGGPNGSVMQGWLCRKWDTGGQGCPPRSPPIGSACTAPPQYCTYGGFCTISVGDDVQCTNGTWQRFASPVGSCALRMCAAGGSDGGAPPTCSMSCPGGACWVQLDGSQTCVKPPVTPPLDMCQGTDPTCCLKDTDCTLGTAGRCLPLRQVKENFCGGAIPFGNVCKYDQCRTDVDCKAVVPAGTTVSACVPAGALNNFDAACVYGVCRTHADCTLHSGGRCQYGQAPTHGMCVLRNVFFCAYPSDPCGNPDSKACPTGQICVPNDNYQGRQCGAGPPAYP